MIKTALISVSDKSKLLSLASALIEKGVKIYSTGGTYDTLGDSFIVHKVEDLTNVPEMLGGRAKTLHPNIYAGILARRNVKDDMKTLKKNKIIPIDLVICNLYPFHTNPSMELVDIGGPCMVRAAAKNYEGVVVLTSPDQYEEFAEKFEEKGIDEVYRHKLAGQAFQHVTEYDMAIAHYFSDEYAFRSYKKVKELKYGLNPNQKAAVYSHDMPFTCLNGDYGYINTIDALNAWNLVLDLKKAVGSQVCAASFKHTSPAGVAIGSTPYDAFLAARECDSKSGFGDFIAISDHVDGAASLAIRKVVSDGIIAPSFSRIALQNLKKKKGGGYVILKGKLPTHGREFRDISGLTLVQYHNDADTTLDLPTVDAIIANTTLKYSQSNSIAFATGGQCVVGAGQQNRADCIRIAGEKMKTMLLKKEKTLQFEGEFTGQEKVNMTHEWIESGEAFTEDEVAKVLSNHNIVMASDASLPSEDNISVATQYGVNVIVQTGGSVRDDEVKKAAEKAGMAMIMTGQRLFLH